MASDANEEKLLRSVTLQNAKSILAARQRAEQKLIEAKAALELRTEELAHSLAMMRATLESTTDGILVTDGGGKVTAFNGNFVDMWRIPSKTMDSREHRQLLEVWDRQFKDPDQFRLRVEEIYASSPPESYDLLELVDGRVVERVSKIQRIDERNVGRVWSFRDITERRRAEEALQKQSEWLRVTLFSIGDAVITTDTEARVTSLNPVAESLTGWTQQEARGRPLNTVFRNINEQTRQPVENPATRALKEGVIVGLANHSVLIRKDGTERPIDDSVAPIKDEQGHVAGCVLIFRDVTEKRRAEETLQQSEERYRSLTQAITSVVWTVDEAGRFVTPQPSWSEFTGQTWEELRDFGWVNALHADDRERVWKLWEAARAARTLYKSEGRLWHAASGSYRHFEARGVPILNPDGSVREWVGKCLDVEDRKRAEQALRESEERFRQLAENIRDVFWITECPERRISYVSPAYERLWGFDPNELYRHYDAWIRAMHPEDCERAQTAFRDKALAGTFDEEYRMVMADGSVRWVRDRCFPLRDERGEVYRLTGIAQDITERKRAEETLKEADRRKNEFLAMLAHELRNPLAPIRNALQVMRLKGANSEAVQSTSAMMERQVDQVVRLVDDLLDVSRISRGKIELRRGRIELASAVNHAVEAIRPQCKSRDHALAVTLPPRPVYLNADPTRLAQVVGNLLNNSCKFTERGGRIWLSVELEGGQAVIRVRDTGIGIAADQLPRIFEMFTQVDTSLERTQGGLGIGLTLVRELVELHDGTLEAHSAGIGQGSEFVVRLPILVETPKPSPEPTVSEPTPTTARRILVVDDNPDSAESLAMLLKITGHETHMAHDGLEAVEAAERFRPDVVLLDIGLPKLNGYDACGRIREQPWGMDMVLVALTGWGQEEDRRKSKDAGFDAHLVKPVDYRALMKLLDSLTSEQDGPLTRR